MLFRNFMHNCSATLYKITPQLKNLFRTFGRKYVKSGQPNSCPITVRLYESFVIASFGVCRRRNSLNQLQKNQKIEVLLMLSNKRIV